MKSPKHLLKMPDGTPLYQHQIQSLRQACPEAPVVYISLAKDSPVDGLLLDAEGAGLGIIHDLDANEAAQSAGPAQGLLAAHHSDPMATWLVLAVDYPLITAEALQLLRRAYKPPVTCYENQDGFCEPLVGIWSPKALERLRANVQKGRGSPSAVVRELGGHHVKCPDHGGAWLMNVNTEGDWEGVLQRATLVDAQEVRGT